MLERMGERELGGKVRGLSTSWQSCEDVKHSVKNVVDHKTTTYGAGCRLELSGHRLVSYIII